MMKKLLFLIICVFPVFGLTSCDKVEDTIPASVTIEDVSLNKASLTLIVGTSEKLIETIRPLNAENKTVIWESSKQSIATVIDGKVSAIKAGSTIITVTTEEGAHFDECVLTVKDRSIDIADSNLLAALLNENKGHIPSNIDSNNDGEISFEEAKLVTKIDVSNSEITSMLEMQYFTELLDINCSENLLNNEKTKVTESISLDISKNLKLKNIDCSFNRISELDIKANKDLENLMCGHQKYNDGTPMKIVIWMSLDQMKNNVIDIDNPANKDIEIDAGQTKVKNVTISKSAITLDEGSSATLIASITPSDATNQNIIWTSSDDVIATVEKGEITALEEGSVVITVTTEDGNKTANCVVEVLKSTIAVTSVTLNKSQTTLDIDDNEILIATINPSDATNQNLTWASSDDAIATVEKGEITALKEGSVVITVTTEDGN